MTVRGMVDTGAINLLVAGEGNIVASGNGDFIYNHDDYDSGDLWYYH